MLLLSTAFHFHSTMYFISRTPSRTLYGIMPPIRSCKNKKLDKPTRAWSSNRILTGSLRTKHGRVYRSPCWVALQPAEWALSDPTSPFPTYDGQFHQQFHYLYTQADEGRIRKIQQSRAHWGLTTMGRESLPSPPWGLSWPICWRLGWLTRIVSSGAEDIKAQAHYPRARAIYVLSSFIVKKCENPETKTCVKEKK